MMDEMPQENPIVATYPGGVSLFGLRFEANPALRGD